MQRYLIALCACAFVLAGSALAQTQGCPDLTALQKAAGYVTFRNFFAGLGALVFAAGLIFFTRGFIFDLLYHMRVLFEAMGYAASAALILGGTWVSQEYLVWTVFVGCILFMGCVFLTIAIHEFKGKDPKPVAAILLAVWAPVAIYYNMTEVGILAILALMTLLGYGVFVGHLSYAFGFEKDADMPRATTVALMMLAFFVAQRAAFPSAPAYVSVFAPGAFWAGSLVAVTGLLIMSWKGYSDTPGVYGWMQIVTIFASLGGIFAGLVLDIGPLTGFASALLGFYFAAKPFDVEAGGLTAFGLRLMFSGAVIFGMWHYAMKNDVLMRQFLSVSIG